MGKVGLVGLLAGVMSVVGCGEGGSGGGTDGTPFFPPLVLVSIQVTPGSAEVLVGETAAFAVRGTYSDQSTGVVAVTWSSLDPGIATIDDSGTATGVAPGTAAIQATAVSDPGIAATATLKVKQEFLFGYNGSGILKYVANGGEPVLLPLTAAPGTTLPTWGGLEGIAWVDGDLYLLHGVAPSETSRIFRVDLATNQVSLAATCPGTNFFSLAADGQGKIFTSSQRTREIFSFDPADDSLTAVAPTDVGIGLQVALDANEDFFVCWLVFGGPSSAWVSRVTRAGGSSIVLIVPEPDVADLGPLVVAGGMTVEADGALDVAAMTGGPMCRGVDLNSDGDFLDPGEVSAASESFAWPAGIFAKSDGVLVNEDRVGIYRVQNLSRTLWSSTPLGFGNSSGNMCRGFESGAPATLPPTITTTTLPAGTVGTAYFRTLRYTGGSGSPAWSVVSGSLPGGFTLNSATGVLAGTPSATGTYSFTVQVSAGGTDTQALTLVINPASPGDGDVVYD